MLRLLGMRPRTLTGVLLTYFACWGLVAPPTLAPTVWGQEADPPAKYNDLFKVEEARRAAGKLREAQEMIGEQIALLPREEFELDALAELLGQDVEVIYQAVSEQTQWLPYSGALRSPQMVQMSRGGNSLDRARFLAALLGKGGHEVRLANGQLSDEACTEFIQREYLATRQDGAVEQQVNDQLAPDELGRQVDELATGSSLSPAAIRSGIAEQQMEQQSLLENAVGRFARTSSALARALQETGGLREEDPDTARRRARETARDHWWVQVRDGSAWLDLDPAHPSRTAGNALTDAERTLPVVGILGREDIESSVERPFDVHRVVVRVKAVQATRDEVIEHVVLEETIDVSRLTAPTFEIHLVPLDLPQDFDPFAEEDPKAAVAEVRTLLMSQQEWMPVLKLDGREISQKSIRTSGELVDRPARGTSGRKIASAARALGGLGEGEEPESVLAAAWVEYEVNAPKQPPITCLRTLFRISPEFSADDGAIGVTESQRLKRAYGLMTRTRGILQTGRWASAFVDARQLQAAHRSISQLPAILQSAMRNEEMKMIQRASAVESPPFELLSLGATRFAINPLGRRVYIDRPNLLTTYSKISLGDDGREKVLSGIDIVLNGTSVIPGNVEEGDEPPAQVRFLQGVADTVAEAVIVESMVPSPAVEMITPAGFSVPEGKLIVVKSASELEQYAGFSTEARTAARTQLEAGRWVIIPSDQQRSEGGDASGTWWRFDPESGETLGMLGETGGAMVRPPAVEWKILLISIAVGLISGFMAFFGCGGLAEDSSPKKRLACGICGLFVAAAATLAVYFAGAAVVGVGRTVMGNAWKMAVLEGGGGAASVVFSAAKAQAMKAAIWTLVQEVVGWACNAVSGAMSRTGPEAEQNSPRHVRGDSGNPYRGDEFWYLASRAAC